MINEGDVITVVPSQALTEMKLDDLVGHSGIVTTLMTSRRNAGCMVHFGARYLGEQNWFIPIASIETESQAERKRRSDMIMGLTL